MGYASRREAVGNATRDEWGVEGVLMEMSVVVVGGSVRNLPTIQRVDEGTDALAGDECHTAYCRQSPIWWLGGALVVQLVVATHPSITTNSWHRTRFNNDQLDTKHINPPLPHRRLSPQHSGHFITHKRSVRDCQQTIPPSISPVPHVRPFWIAFLRG